MDYKDIIDNFDSSPQAEESGLLYLESRYGGMTANVENTRSNSLQYPCSFTEEELDARLDQAEKDFEAGRYFSNESVIAELNQFVQAL